MVNNSLTCRCIDCGLSYKTNPDTETIYNKCIGCRTNYGGIEDQLEAIKLDQLRHNKELRRSKELN
ncbi:MAG: hypothetical protein CMH63_01070 [Nanoarchaeota archaeon]|jgi:hypothetical protein|nr:hypothetical protein [Nanoarchaeota archaeon]|tara:strand:+ start:13737 stop:13934 length:198 start_codon:yes stop_codon:yes gene_type:complete